MMGTWSPLQSQGAYKVRVPELGWGLKGVEKPRKGSVGKVTEFLENRMASNREGSHEAELLMIFFCKSVQV